MSTRNAVDVAFAIAVSAAVLYGGWHWFGAFGLVFGMPVLALFAIPIVNLTSAFPRLAGRLALRRYEGRFYAFRGRQVDIDIDPDAQCWVSTADARKILPSLPADAVMARVQPGQVAETGDPLKWRVTPAALAVVLGRSTDPEARKFLMWLEGDVVNPARKRRERRMKLQ